MNEAATVLSLTPSEVISGYCLGLFPFGDLEADAGITWHDPLERSLIPLDGLHIPRRLARLIRKGDFRVTLDQEFAGVVEACSHRPETWINKEMKLLYAMLHSLGIAHSIEAWKCGQLAGGLIGVQLGAVFYGESMFSKISNSSKVALVYLVEHLRNTGFELLDVQMQTDHLDRFGAVVVDRVEFRRRLSTALQGSADVRSLPLPTRIAGVHIE